MKSLRAGMQLNARIIEELRKTRQEKKISLDDISRSTRISTKFLEAIERGNFDVLPRPYVRSIIKQYAQYVGFDVEKILSELDQTIREPSAQKDGLSPGGATGRHPPSGNVSPRLKIMFISLAVIGSIALIVYLLMGVSNDAADPITQRPFWDVVREIEEEAERTAVFPVDTAAQFHLEPRDSVSFEVTTLDTVWLTITIDNVTQLEYLFPPGLRRQWMAANEFLVTVGNAGGLTVSVNGDSLGVLGTPGQVIRNLQITRDGIQH